MSALCWPWWKPVFQPLVGTTLGNTVLSSGCAINQSTGNIACAPDDMRRSAEAKLAQLGFPRSLSLETYTLARYMQGEVGSGTIEDRVAVGEAAVNRARLERLPKGILSLLLYRQSSSSPNYGWYGPIHASDAECARRGLSRLCHPFGRWATTSQDPTVLTTLLAELITSGDSNDFANGADDQSDVFNSTAYPNPAATIRGWASKGDYWVGPIVGVNHRHTFLMRHYGYASSSPEGAALLARGLDALSLPAPTWPADLPVCSRPIGWGPILAAIGGLIGGAWWATRAAMRGAAR